MNYARLAAASILCSSRLGALRNAIMIIDDFFLFYVLIRGPFYDHTPYLIHDRSKWYSQTHAQCRRCCSRGVAGMTRVFDHKQNADLRIVRVQNGGHWKSDWYGVTFLPKLFVPGVQIGDNDALPLLMSRVTIVQP